MRKIDEETLHKKLREIDENTSIYIATLDRYYVRKLKNNNPDIEKIVIYKPILFEELKRKLKQFYRSTI